MSKKSETKKPAEKKTTKTAPESKAKAAHARAEAKKPADTKAKKEPQPAVPETLAAPTNATPPKPASAASHAPHTPDPRLPAPGTLLQKRDRHNAVRCECTVEADGIRYAGKLYKSLSAAAMAAAKDLGLVNKTQNGWTFWGLTKAPRPARDPLAAVERAWERYHGNVEALVKDGITDENRTKVLATIKKHVQALENLGDKVA